MGRSLWNMVSHFTFVYKSLRCLLSLSAKENIAEKQTISRQKICNGSSSLWATSTLNRCIILLWWRRRIQVYTRHFSCLSMFFLFLRSSITKLYVTTIIRLCTFWHFHITFSCTFWAHLVVEWSLVAFLIIGFLFFCT